MCRSEKDRAEGKGVLGSTIQPAFEGRGGPVQAIGDIDAMKVTVNYTHRFWDKVVKGSQPSDCWSWTAAKTEHGYGVMGKGGRGNGNIKAPRVSMELHLGRALLREEQVLHTCDNPECTNPLHLFIGNPRINHYDKMAKGRATPPPHYVGAANPASKLTKKAVLSIRSLQGVLKAKDIAEAYGVDPSLICLIFKRKVWKHV